MSFCDIYVNIIDLFRERSNKKLGKYTPVTHIPIVPDSTLIEYQPDYAIIFAHNWSEQIKESLIDYKGEWIVANQDAEIFKNTGAWWERSGRLSNGQGVAI